PSAPVASTIAVPRKSLTSRFANELSSSSTSELPPKRRYEPGLSRISTRPSQSVRTRSPEFRSSVIISCCQLLSPFELTVAPPVIALIPPALAEMTNLSRLWPRVTSEQHSTTATESKDSGRDKLFLT